MLKEKHDVASCTVGDVVGSVKIDTLEWAIKRSDCLLVHVV